jgi:hypothetical protein
LKSYKNSFSENITDLSVLNEKTVNKDDMKNLMPSQRLAFMNRKKSPEGEEVRQSQSSVKNKQAQ